MDKFIIKTAVVLLFFVGVFCVQWIVQAETNESSQEKNTKLTVNVLDLQGESILLEKETIDPQTITNLDIAVWQKVDSPQNDLDPQDYAPHIIVDSEETLWQRIAVSKTNYWYGTGDVKKSVRNEPLPFTRTLVPGTYRVSAVLGENSKPGYAGIDRCIAAGFGKSISLDGTQKEITIDLPLEKGVSATIQLMDPDTKQPLDDRYDQPMIRLIRPDEFRIGGDFSEDPHLRKASDGLYHFGNLVPGDYRLLVCTPIVDPQNLIAEYCGDEFPLTISDEGSNTFQVEPKNCLKRNWPWSISGTVRDENGNPVANATISAQYAVQGIYIYRWAYTDEQGKYDLRMLPNLFEELNYLPKDPETNRVRLNFKYSFWDISVKPKGMKEESRTYDGQLILLGDAVTNVDEAVKYLAQDKKQNSKLLLRKNVPAEGYDFVVIKE